MTRKRHYTSKQKHFIGSFTMGFVVSILIILINILNGAETSYIVISIVAYWSVYEPISALLYWIHSVNKYIKETDLVVNQLLKELQYINTIMLHLSEEDKNV